MSISDDAILRQLKRRVGAQHAEQHVRVAGIDDWSWRKGRNYRTIIVDLERREVVDVLSERSAAGTDHWLSQHPGVEIVSRDRCGLYAQGAREGAPQAQQVADRCLLPTAKTRAARPSREVRGADVRSRSIDIFRGEPPK